MSIIPIGEMHHRIRLEEPLRTSEDGGGASVTWSLVAEVWGALRPSGGAEVFEADSLKARASQEIWIRHREDVRPEMRFVLDTRTFDIRSVTETPGRKRFLRCLVEERLP
jgi:SPP1 family predicted phage head-tail adaptor